MQPRDFLKKAIKIYGKGAIKFAREVEISETEIYRMINGHRKISMITALKVEKAVKGKVTRRELNPDYPWELIPESSEY